jgi:hypothetical protein
MRVCVCVCVMYIKHIYTSIGDVTNPPGMEKPCRNSNGSGMYEHQFFFMVTLVPGWEPDMTNKLLTHVTGHILQSQCLVYLLLKT